MLDVGREGKGNDRSMYLWLFGRALPRFRHDLQLAGRERLGALVGFVRHISEDMLECTQCCNVSRWGGDLQ